MSKRTAIANGADPVQQKAAVDGNAAYDDKTIEEGDDEWLETVSVEKCD